MKGDDVTDRLVAVTKDACWEVVDEGCTWENFESVREVFTCFPLNSGAFGKLGVGIAMTSE
jgi:hypothetical protein